MRFFLINSQKIYRFCVGEFWVINMLLLARFGLGLVGISGIICSQLPRMDGLCELYVHICVCQLDASLQHKSAQ